MDDVAYKIRLHPTKEHEKFLRSNIGECRFVWNILDDLQDSYCYAPFLGVQQIFARKAQSEDKRIVLFGRWFSSFQICSVCGVRTGVTKDLDVRPWTCISCGAVHGMDFKDSVNILAERLRTLDTETDAESEWFRQCTAAQTRRRNVRGGHTEGRKHSKLRRPMKRIVRCKLSTPCANMAKALHSGEKKWLDTLLKYSNMIQ